MSNEAPRKTETIQIRLTIEEKEEIKRLARAYAKGNISAWLIHGSDIAPRVPIQEPKIN